MFGWLISRGSKRFSVPAKVHHTYTHTHTHAVYGLSCIVDTNQRIRMGPGLGCVFHVSARKQSKSSHANTKIPIDSAGPKQSNDCQNTVGTIMCAHRCTAINAMAIGELNS